MMTQKQKVGIEKLYSKKSASDLLRISVAGIDRLRKSGELRSVKIGGLIRFKESELIRLIEEA